MATSSVAMPTRGMPANAVHEEMVRALGALQAAEKRAVMWFAEIVNRRLYVELGFASIYDYATRSLSFSKSKTAQFLRLARSFTELPALRQAVASGDLPWTKAREVLSVATPGTEKRWLEAARSRSRRELVDEVSRAKAAARDVVDGLEQMAVDRSTPEVVEPTLVPITLSFRLSVEQAGRVRASIETLRRRGHRESRDEMVAEAFELLAAATSEASAPSATSSASRVVTYVCEKCTAPHIASPRGDESIPLTTLARQLCDAQIVHPGARRRRTLTPATRMRVLARDGHRCRAKGCTHTMFLDVHHIRPVSRGGTNDDDNLITLCRSCHRSLHERESPRRTRTRVHAALARSP